MQALCCAVPRAGYDLNIVSIAVNEGPQPRLGVAFILAIHGNEHIPDGAGMTVGCLQLLSAFQRDGVAQVQESIKTTWR
jgi:hypothetical protein